MNNIEILMGTSQAEEDALVNLQGGYMTVFPFPELHLLLSRMNHAFSGVYIPERQLFQFFQQIL